MVSPFQGGIGDRQGEADLPCEETRRLVTLLSVRESVVTSPTWSTMSAVSIPSRVNSSGDEQGLQFLVRYVIMCVRMRMSSMLMVGTGVLMRSPLTTKGDTLIPGSMMSRTDGGVFSFSCRRGSDDHLPDFHPRSDDSVRILPFAIHPLHPVPVHPLLLPSRGNPSQSVPLSVFPSRSYPVDPYFPVRPFVKSGLRIRRESEEGVEGG